MPERLVAHKRIRPDRLNQPLLRKHPAGVLGKIEEHLHDFRLDLNRFLSFFREAV